MEYLHDRHIVHMDIKPENIMCTQREGTTIKIVDFGTALLLSPGHRVLYGVDQSYKNIDIG